MHTCIGTEDLYRPYDPYGGDRCTALLFLDHGTRRGEGSAWRSGRSLPPGKDSVPIVQEAGRAPELLWTGAENIAPTGIRSPDRPARSQSLYQLSYPGPFFLSDGHLIWICPSSSVVLCSSVGTATGYGLDGPGIESRWGRDFPPFQTGSGAHPASCTIGTVFFRGVKNGRGVTLNPHPLLVPRSWKNRAIPLLPLWAVRPVQSLIACTSVHLTLPYLFTQFFDRWKLMLQKLKMKKKYLIICNRQLFNLILWRQSEILSFPIIPISKRTLLFGMFPGYAHSSSGKSKRYKEIWTEPCWNNIDRRGVWKTKFNLMVVTD